MKKIYDLIIVGGGPAGVTAGIYALRQKLKTLMLTKDFGGQLNRKAVMIENFPGFEEISGKELTEKFFSHLKRYPVEIEIDEVKRVKKEKEVFVIETKSQKEFFSKALILSSGVKSRILNVKGEKEFLGKGVSYCAVCDGYFFNGKTVAVIGGGNSGFEAAIFLSKLAKKIYILEFSNKVKADSENQEIVKRAGNIEIILNAKVEEIKGDKFVKSLVYRDLVSNELKEILVEGVFVEIGNVPETSFVEDLVDLNEKGEIIVDFQTMATKTPGLFAAGDCVSGKYKQIIIAAGEGAKAALSAFDYLQKLKP
jgi:NADH-dependent peroxiredoxin subunit F